MKAPASREDLRGTTLIVLMALFFSGSCASRRQIGIEDVLDAMTAADRKIDNYCSLERLSTYDRNGRLKEGERRGVHFYAKPDESLLCVQAPAGPSSIYYEIGTTVKSVKDGKAGQRTLSDSFFLRDWRSMMRLHRGEAPFPAESAGAAAPPVRFEFAAGDPHQTAWRGDGIYEIRMTRTGYERTVLRVNVLLGVVLEKWVYRLPGGILSAREAHSDFVPLAGTYLPGRTMYEYGEEKVVIDWSDYRANLPVDLQRMSMDEATCERLTALTAPVRTARRDP